MQHAATAQNAMPRFQPEVQEVKKSLPLRKVDETKSEFERSRQASKTWSMGQYPLRPSESAYPTMPCSSSR